MGIAVFRPSSAEKAQRKLPEAMRLSECTYVLGDHSNLLEFLQLDPSMPEFARTFQSQPEPDISCTDILLCNLICNLHS